jgi:hypothetical protein
VQGVVVGDSRGKPGEYADVSAYVAQLASWKCQVGVAVELKGKLYSGDWTHKLTSTPSILQSST